MSEKWPILIVLAFAAGIFQPSVNRVALNVGPHISYQDVHMTVGISGMTPRGVMLGVGYARKGPYTRFHKSEDSFDVHALNRVALNVGPHRSPTGSWAGWSAGRRPRCLCRIARTSRWGFATSTA